MKSTLMSLKNCLLTITPVEEATCCKCKTSLKPFFVLHYRCIRRNWRKWILSLDFQIFVLAVTVLLTRTLPKVYGITVRLVFNWKFPVIGLLVKTLLVFRMFRILRSHELKLEIWSAVITKYPDSLSFSKLNKSSWFIPMSWLTVRYRPKWRIFLSILKKKIMNKN